MYFGNNLLCKSVNWFLYDRFLRHEKVKATNHFSSLYFFSVTSSFLLGFSGSSDNITTSNKKKNTSKSLSVHLRNCNLGEWDEKCHYASDILFYIERKWLFMWNFATVLPLKPKLSGKFQRFSAIDISIKMLKYSWLSRSFN